MADRGVDPGGGPGSADGVDSGRGLVLGSTLQEPPPRVEALNGSRPRDTSHEAWREQRAALDRLGPQGRFAVAMDLSEAIRTIQLEGIQARHPEWSRAEAVRYLVEARHGVRLPKTP